MPKVIYTNAKGLYQESGSGVDLTSGAGMRYRKTEVDGSGGNVTLVAADSGKVVVLSGGARTVTLPDHAIAAAGWFVTIIAGSTHNHVLDTGADDILYGSVIHRTGGTTVAVQSVEAQQKITCTAGLIGDRIDVYCDGTYFHVSMVCDAAVTLATS